MISYFSSLARIMSYIMAVTGNKSVSEIERYTREAAQPGLAASAILKIE